MRAMILAAGLGTRMGALTASTPKPMLHAGGKPLLQFHLEALARAGYRDVVINHSRHGDQIERAFADGGQLGLAIRYSAEGNAPLETAGGIRQALAFLGRDPFLVVNADVWTDFDLSLLRRRSPEGAHIVLVPNPDHHPGGDFCLDGERVSLDQGRRLTYAGVGVFHPQLFDGLPSGVAPLAPLLRSAVGAGRVTGECHTGHWFDIGTPARLEALTRLLTSAG